MDAGLASTVMGKLRYREGYADFEKRPSDDNLAFKAVRDHKASGIRSGFLSVSVLISQQLDDLSYTAARLTTLSVRISPVCQQSQVRAASASMSQSFFKCLADSRHVAAGSCP